MKTLFFALCVFVISSRLSAADKPAPNVLSADLKRLDALQRVFSATQARDDQFGDTFWRASKRLGERTGPRIVHAVIVPCRSFHDEEGLIFVPLVAMLDRKSTLAILRQYRRSHREADRVTAREMMIEFEAEDTKQGVARFSRRH